MPRKLLFDLRPSRRRPGDGADLKWVLLWAALIGLLVVAVPWWWIW